MKKLLSDLKCLECNSNLHKIDGKFNCENCNSKFNIVKNVPILMEEYSLEGKTIIKSPVTYENIIDILKMNYSSGLKVLEIGAGQSQYREIFDHEDYVSSDIITDYTRNLIGVDLICDCKNLPFDDGKFDIVFCSGVYNLLPEVGKCTGEISRVLKKGGKFLDFDYCYRTQIKLSDHEKSHNAYKDDFYVDIFESNNLKINFITNTNYNYLNNKVIAKLLNLLSRTPFSKLIDKYFHWRIIEGIKK
ncbi:MAG: class I SAM-dependent methyltransferase [Acidaminobacteraceae bacterium]